MHSQTLSNSLLFKMLLYKAASEGNYLQLQKALALGANPNFISKSEQLSSLHAAARSTSSPDKNSALLVSDLLDKGARVSLKSISDRNEAIHEAANVGAEDTVRVLIQASPKSIMSENAYGNTALHAATRAGSFDVVKLLLESGSLPNAQNHRGSTALHIACFLASALSSDKTDSVDPFLKIGALLCNEKIDIDTPDVNKYTALHIAAQRGCDDMVKLLISSGASLTAQTAVDTKGRGGRTPFGTAAFAGHESTRKILERAMSNGGELHLSVNCNEMLKVGTGTEKLAAQKLLESS